MGKRRLIFLRALILGGLLSLLAGNELFLVPTVSGMTRHPNYMAMTIHPSFPSQNRRLVIAIVPKSLDNPVFVDAKETAELTARKLNVILEWIAPFKVDPEAQLKIVEGLIRRKVDGIAISCSDPQRLKGVIAKAMAAGIKVATMDADCPGSQRVFYCGTDNYQAGYACGEAMTRIIRQRGMSGRELSIVVLTGGIKAHNLNDRIRGFKAATKKLKLQYKALLSSDDDTTTAAREVEAYLKKNPKTDLFFFAGGWAFFGPIESMPLYQEWSRSGGIAVSMDTFYPVLQTAKKGFLQALVGQDFRTMGEFTVSYLVCAIKGLPIPSEYIYTGLERADGSNYDQLLKVKKPWEMK